MAMDYAGASRRGSREIETAPSMVAKANGGRSSSTKSATRGSAQYGPAFHRSGPSHEDQVILIEDEPNGSDVRAAVGSHG